MVSINWGLLGPPSNAGNAFTQGLEQGREVRRQREVQSALSAYAQNPGDERAFSALATAAPQMAIGISERRAAAQGEVQQRNVLADVTTRAASGDATAMQTLAGLDPATWRQLNTQQQAKATQGVEMAGQLARRVASMPPDQQAAGWDQAIDGLVAAGFDTFSQYRGQFSPQALDRVLAQAGELGDVMGIRYQAVPEGGYLQGFDSFGRPIGETQGEPPAPAPSPTTPAPQGEFQVAGLNGDRVTSRQRSPDRNRAVGGVANSFHLTGQAEDRVPPPGMSMAAYHAELVRMNPDKDVINEGDHIHIEPRSRRTQQAAAMPSGFVLD